MANKEVRPRCSVKSFHIWDKATNFRILFLYVIQIDE